MPLLSQVQVQQEDSMQVAEQAGLEGMQSIQRICTEDDGQNTSKFYDKNGAYSVQDCVLSGKSASEHSEHKEQLANNIETYEQISIPFTEIESKSVESKGSPSSLSALHQERDPVKENGKLVLINCAESLSTFKPMRRQSRKERKALQRQVAKIPEDNGNPASGRDYFFRGIEILKLQEIPKQKKNLKAQSGGNKWPSSNGDPSLHRDYIFSSFQKSQSRKERRRLKKMERSVSYSPPSTTRVMSSDNELRPTHSKVCEGLSKNGQNQSNQKSVCIPPLPVNISPDFATQSRRNDRAIVRAAVSDDLDVYDRTEASYVRSNIETGISETHSSNSDADSCHNSELSLSTFLDQLLQTSPENDFAEKIELRPTSACFRCKDKPVSAGVLHRQR